MPRHPSQNSPLRGNKKSGKGKEKDDKKKTQTSLGFKKIKKQPQLITEDILLGEEIFTKAAPAEFKGQLFHYQVSSYDATTEEYTAQYQVKMIKEDGGVEWVHQDGPRDKIEHLKYETVKQGITRYSVKITAINDHRLEKVKAATKMLKKKEGNDSDDEDEILVQMYEAAEKSDNGWYSMDIINLEFELTGETG
jgi:hypothetical protein